MKFLNIAFDLDDTLVDFTAAFKASLLQHFGVAGEPGKIYTNFIDEVPTDVEHDYCFDDIYFNYAKMPVFPGVVDLLKLLWLATGDPITIVSARPITIATLSVYLLAS